MNSSVMLFVHGFIHCSQTGYLLQRALRNPGFHYCIAHNFSVKIICTLDLIRDDRFSSLKICPLHAHYHPYQRAAQLEI